MHDRNKIYATNQHLDKKKSNELLFFFLIICTFPNRTKTMMIKKKNSKTLFATLSFFLCRSLNQRTVYYYRFVCISVIKISKPIEYGAHKAILILALRLYFTIQLYVVVVVVVFFSCFFFLLYVNFFNIRFSDSMHFATTLLPIGVHISFNLKFSNKTIRAFETINTSRMNIYTEQNEFQLVWVKAICHLNHFSFFLLFSLHFELVHIQEKKFFLSVFTSFYVSDVCYDFMAFIYIYIY